MLYGLSTSPSSFHVCAFTLTASHERTHDPVSSVLVWYVPLAVRVHTYIHTQTHTHTDTHIHTHTNTHAGLLVAQRELSPYHMYSRRGLSRCSRRRYKHTPLTHEWTERHTEVCGGVHVDCVWSLRVCFVCVCVELSVLTASIFDLQ